MTNRNSIDLAMLPDYALKEKLDELKAARAAARNAFAEARIALKDAEEKLDSISIEQLRYLREHDRRLHNAQQ